MGTKKRQNTPSPIEEWDEEVQLDASAYARAIKDIEELKYVQDDSFADSFKYLTQAATTSTNSLSSLYGRQVGMPMVGGTQTGHTTGHTAWNINCLEHSVTEAAYIDGKLLAVCSTCQQTITIDLPGGLLVERVKTLLSEMIDEAEDDLDSVLAFKNILQVLRNEEKALLEAMALIRTAREMVVANGDQEET